MALKVITSKATSIKDRKEKVFFIIFGDTNLASNMTRIKAIPWGMMIKGRSKRQEIKKVILKRETAM